MLGSCRSLRGLRCRLRVRSSSAQEWPSVRVYLLVSCFVVWCSSWCKLFGHPRIPSPAPFHGLLLTLPAPRPPRDTERNLIEFQSDFSILTQQSLVLQSYELCENTLKFSLDLFVLISCVSFQWPFVVSTRDLRQASLHTLVRSHIGCHCIHRPRHMRCTALRSSTPMHSTGYSLRPANRYTRIHECHTFSLRRRDCRAPHGLPHVDDQETCRRDVSMLFDQCTIALSHDKGSDTDIPFVVLLEYSEDHRSLRSPAQPHESRGRGVGQNTPTDLSFAPPYN